MEMQREEMQTTETPTKEVDGRGRSISTAILYEVVGAMNAVGPRTPA